LKPKTVRRKARKLESEALIKYVKEHPDAYLKEIAEHFGCVVSAVYQRLKKLGITRKKKLFLYKERDEKKREDKISFPISNGLDILIQSLA
jgi:transposase